MIPSKTCNCASSFYVRVGRVSDYKVVKRLLNRAHYPAYVGPKMYERLAGNGGALLYCHENELVGVFLVNPRTSCALVMAASPEHRAHGIAIAMVQYARPNFVRPLVQFVPLFRMLGYMEVGGVKQAARLASQIMVRRELKTLAGRLRQIRGDERGTSTGDLRDTPLSEAHVETRVR